MVRCVVVGESVKIGGQEGGGVVGLVDAHVSVLRVERDVCHWRGSGVR